MEEKKNPNQIEIGPQEGPQTRFLENPADIIIYGGSGGGGKTYGLLLEPLRHLFNLDFKGVIFRKNSNQIRSEGGLWDTSKKLYGPLGATPRETFLDWKFNKGPSIKFAHLQYDNDVLKWQGSQFSFLGFDEATHFTQYQFFYMLSRLRSMSGVPGYVRATCNPSKISWVRKFIDWWIGPNGFPIADRDGILRWFIREDDKFIWGDSREELQEKYGEKKLPLSVTFIRSSIYDNKILLDSDPQYLANLSNLNRVEKAQLLDGNWDVEPQAGDYFKREQFEIIDSIPAEDITIIVRAWDKAASEPKDGTDPDWTVGVKMGMGKSGHFYILDMVRLREGPFKVEQAIVNTAKRDRIGVEIKIFQDPGSAGVYETQSYLKLLSGFIVSSEKIIRDKETAAKPFSSQVGAGNVKILRGDWNEDLLSELENFPVGKKDDIVDACSSAFNHLTGGLVGDFSSEFVDDDDNVNEIDVDGVEIDISEDDQW